MAHFVASIRCQATPERVFAYLADFRHAADWDPSVTRVEGEDPALGARARVFLGTRWAETCLDYRTTRYEPNRHVAFRAESPLFRSLDTIDLEAEDGGCLVRYDADLRLHGLARLIDLPTHLTFQISGARSLAGLERALARLEET